MENKITFANFVGVTVNWELAEWVYSAWKNSYQLF